LHTEKFVQLIDGFSRAGFGREHGEKLLQLVIVEPQAVAAGTFVEGQGGGAGVFDLNLMQRGIAPRAKMGAAFRFGTRLVLEFQQRIGGLRAGAFHDGFQFARIEPESAAPMTEIDVEIPKMQDKQGHITFWTDAFHAKPRAGNDGASGAEASSTSRIARSVVTRLFIGGNQAEDGHGVIYK
jgi:hypothetical protein